MTMNHRPDESRDDRELARLFEDASPRPRAPDAHRDAVFAAVHARWDELAARRARRRHVVGWALAASLVLSVGWILLPGVDLGDSVTVATAARVKGDVEWAREDGEWRALETDTVLRAGDRLRVGDGALALAPVGGGSLRIASASTVSLGEPPALALDQGRVYFDSHYGQPGARIRVETPFGVVADVGTQFAVVTSAAGLDVAVRSGSASVTRAGDALVARAGERLVLAADGTARTEALIVTGDAWAWAEQLAPAFRLQGRSYRALLEWYARETGYRLEYTSEQARITARELIEASGSVERPDLERLRYLLRTAGLTVEQDASRATLVIAMQD